MRHTKMPAFKFPQPRGFTLIEIAIALFIVTLLLSAILVPLQKQMEQRRISETQKSLAEIKEALIGFAMMNDRLPYPSACASSNAENPTTTDLGNDPADPTYGEENASCAGKDGYLPWKTLGVPPVDAFGTPRVNSGSPRIGEWRYRVDSNFTQKTPCSALFTLTTVPSDYLKVEDSSGKYLTESNPSNSGDFAVAIVFSTGANLAADGANGNYTDNKLYQSDVPSPAFDDILVWITRPTLMNRMVSAGQLPRTCS